MKTNKMAGEILEAIGSNHHVGVTIIDKDGLIIFRNKISEDVSGIKTKDFIGRHFSGIRGKGELLDVLKTGIPKFGTLYRTTTGRHAIINRFPLIINNEIIGAMSIVLFKDTQEMKKLMNDYKLMEQKIEHYEQKLKSLQSAKYSLDCIIGKSDKTVFLRNRIKKHAENSAPVLITGETGTGKELCAHAIHLCSERKNGPFIKINCSSIPRELFESEIFGYEPGSFTNADKKGRIGKFELANHGTIFLDEIASLPLEMQPKLLRILQEKEIERIGGNKVINVDFRLISSTNRDLELMVKENEFRPDLYYRLRVFNSDISPLRERKDDIPELCEHFVKLFNEKFGSKIMKIDKNVLEIFYEWRWPGNVRELKNVLERAFHIAETGVIQIKNLPEYLTYNPKFMYNLSGRNRSINLVKEAKNRFEKSLIESTLAESNWNKSRAASQLGISRPLLYALVKKYGLNKSNLNLTS
jgi:transcriptional regulator with PAS, ATPase and Fis domain